MAKILIVDDSKTSRKMLRSILEEAGMEVIGEASDGIDGVRLYEALKPDLVTLDITMPVMDGIDTLKEIMDRDPSARVVMVTAAGQKGNMMEALKLGALEFVTKPYDTESILDIVKRALTA